MTHSKLSIDQIANEWRGDVSVQNYSGSGGIDGLNFVELRQLIDDGGSFLEIGRLDDAGKLLGVADFQVRQLNFSTLEPGAIKAWHVHFAQEDVWFIPPTSRLVVGLKDIREASPTKGNALRLVMGPGKARLLLIPRGVAHGVANLTQEPQSMIYLVNQHFSLDDPDERRLLWDAFGADFWEMTRG
jgi:dTDP-4-dehydrorhamnose 3,5-epimerase